MKPTLSIVHTEGNLYTNRDESGFSSYPTELGRSYKSLDKSRENNLHDEMSIAVAK
jgi:hypothetical protein